MILSCHKYVYAKLSPLAGMMLSYVLGGFLSYVLIFSIVCSTCYSQNVVEKSLVQGKTFRAALPHVPGYMYRNNDGSPGGFPCEILERLAADEGVVLEWVDGTWAESFDKAKQGEIDILPGTQFSEERKLSLDYMEGSLYTMWSELYIRENVELILGDLNGKKIGLVKDDNNSIQFHKYIDNYNIEYIPVEFDNHAQAYAGLQKGEVYAVVGPRLLDRKLLTKNGLKSGGFYFNPVACTCSFPKGKNPDLVAALDRRLKIYKNDPQSVYYELLDKYGLGASSVAEEVVPQWLSYVLGILGVAVVVAAAVVIVLKKQVNTKSVTIESKEKELLRAHLELKQYSQNLEKKVASRTEELDRKNRELHEALTDVKTSQGRLIMTEKMAVLGHLAAGIAHEINSPLGAIGSASGVISDNSVALIKDVEKLSGWFSGPDGHEIKNILMSVLENQDYSKTLSTRENRVIRNTLSEILSENGIDNSEEFARLLVELKLHTKWQDHIEFLKSTNSLEVLEEFSKLAEILLGCSMIDVAVGKASRIVKALKNYMYSGPNQGDDFTVVPVNIRSSIENVLLLFHNQIKRGIKLDTSYDNVPDVMGDVEQLNQVWTNLIQNALFAIGENGVLSVSISQDGGYVVVDIVDNGCGIPGNIIDKVFDPLFTTKKAGEGTGLGLDIVKKIVEVHAGHINLKSQENEGTQVRVYLPIDNPDNIVDVHMRG